MFTLYCLSLDEEGAIFAVFCSQSWEKCTGLWWCVEDAPVFLLRVICFGSMEKFRVQV